MNTTAIPHTSNDGRASDRVVRHIRAQIEAGQIQSGQYLPTERELAETFTIARMTARRALKTLEANGFIASVPRRGYKVTLRAVNDPGRGCPIAYVLDEPECLAPGDDFHKTLFNVFQHVASRRGSTLLAAYGGPLTPSRTLEQIKAARVWGVAIDSINADLMRLLRDNGLPAVMVDAWREDAEIDTVVQDSYQGGLLAANYLLSRGHRRFAWAGTGVGESSHSMARYGGASAALASAGLSIAPDRFADPRSLGGYEQVRALLARPDRPTGVLALWGEAAQAVARAARDLNLVLGKDLDVVGWSTEEQYRTSYAPGFPDGKVPPAIVWSVAAMAELAITRLAERKANPSLRVAKINVPVRLRSERSEV